MLINKYIDHTLLKANAKECEIDAICEQAVQNDFCAVCVNPCYVAYAKEKLQGSSVKVCTVIGFPLGQNTTETKVFETQNALKNGADEIDMVINVAKFLDKQFDYVRNEIALVQKVCGEKILKVIVETCYLTDEEIRKIAEICVELNVDFIKTSTGFGTRGASLDDVQIMASVVQNKIGIKASGGIKTREFAETLIEAGATRLGTSSGVELVRNDNR